MLPEDPEMRKPLFSFRMWPVWSVLRMSMRPMRSVLKRHLAFASGRPSRWNICRKREWSRRHNGFLADDIDIFITPEVDHAVISGIVRDNINMFRFVLSDQETKISRELEIQIIFSGL